jgi:peptidoglycan/LPS O-acetylase OafA/YrhL
MPVATSPEATKVSYYPALTGIRAIAAYMVMLFHFSQEMVKHEHSLLGKAFIKFMLQWHIGIAIFFVLSGFLITARYAERIQPTMAWAKRYLQNRFARIYPVYFLLTAVAFAVMLWRPQHVWYEWPGTYTALDKMWVILLNITLLRGYFENILTTGLPTAWSLTVEESFYVTAPFVLLAVKSRLNKLVWYPLLMLGVGALLVAFCSHYVPSYGLMARPRFMLNYTFFGRCTEFACGIALALWFAKRPSRALPGSVFTWASLFGLVGYMAAIGVLQRLYPTTGPENWPPLHIGANMLVLPVIVCGLFWGLLNERTLFRKILESKLFDLLGKSSYVLYLVHLGVVDTLFQKYITTDPAMRVVAYTLLSIGLYKYFEHPLHKRLRAAAPGKQPVEMPEALATEAERPGSK